jgi:hypothetical protein
MMLENKVMIIFGPKREEVTGGAKNYKQEKSNRETVGYPGFLVHGCILDRGWLPYHPAFVGHVSASDWSLCWRAEGTRFPTFLFLP